MTGVGIWLAICPLYPILRWLVLSMCLAAITLDIRRCPRRQKPFKNKRLLHLVMAFQCIQTICWVVSTVDQEGGGLYSLSSLGLLCLLAVAPWFCIYQFATRTPWFPISTGLTSTGLAVILLAGCSVTIYEGIGIVGADARNMLVTYGTQNHGMLFGRGARAILPGFPGIVPGGVFCGLALSSCIACIFSKASRSLRVIAGIITLVYIRGILITDTRSAMAVLLLTLSFASVVSIASSSQGQELAAWLARRVLRCSRFAVMVPILIPVVFPLVTAAVDSVSRLPFLELVTRNQNDSILELGGRTPIWQESLRILVERPISLVRFHVVGELGSGVAYELSEKTSQPGLPMFAHSHNTILNTYYSFGVLGVIFVFGILWSIGEIIGKLKLKVEMLAFQLPFFSLIVFMTVESMLANGMRYGGLYLLFLCLDLFHLND